jgi:hypothetical protein
MLFFRQPRTEVIDEERAIGFARANKIELAISRCRLRSKVKDRANRANVHCFPKYVAAEDIFAVDVNLPLLCRLMMKNSAQ